MWLVSLVRVLESVRTAAAVEMEDVLLEVGLVLSLVSALTVGAAEGGRIRELLLVQNSVSEAVEERRRVGNAVRIVQGEVSGSAERWESE